MAKDKPYKVIRKYTVTNIDYDTDNKRIKLPETLEIVIPDDVTIECYEDVELYISDEISNRTGYCHNGFATTPEIPAD